MSDFARYNQDTKEAQGFWAAYLGDQKLEDVLQGLLQKKTNLVLWEDRSYWLEVDGPWVSLWPASKERMLLQHSFNKLAHDLRNPVATILGYSELLKEKPDPEVKEYSQVITQKALKLTKAIQYALDYSRSLMGKSLPWSPTAETENSLFSYLEKKGILLNHIAITEEVRVDKKLILAFFQELRSNSLNYNGPEEPLLALSWEDGMLNLSLGHPKIQSMVFSQALLPFSSANKDRALSGLGLGLNWLGCYAKQMDGELAKIDDTIYLKLTL
jgi:signal transduction histidine kinase